MVKSSRKIFAAGLQTRISFLDFLQKKWAAVIAKWTGDWIECHDWIDYSLLDHEKGRSNLMRRQIVGAARLRAPPDFFGARVGSVAQLVSA